MSLPLRSQSLFPEEPVQERVGLPCSPGFHRQIEKAVVKLREHGNGQGGAIVDLSRFVQLGLANAQRYSLIHFDDFAAVLAFQTIFPGLYRGEIERLYTATVPTHSPTPWDYAVQIAAFYFCFTHEVHGTAFRRLLLPNYRRRVLNSYHKWQAALHSQPQGFTTTPPPLAPELRKQSQLKELQELQQRHEQEIKELKLRSFTHSF